jgi:RHS repeat-associated protein
VATANSTQATNYSYDPWGRRMWEEIPGLRDSQNNQLTNTTCEIYFYGVTGQKLETYSCSYTGGGFVSSLEGINIYFGKKLLQSKGAWVVTDKLGTVRANASLGAINYFPYGEERTSTANGVEKFGTYTRDAVGQDYAQQRYYNSSVGAFWTPDSGGIKTANPRNPLSWNRYAYTKGNPINRFDPSGRIDCDPDDNDGCYCDDDPDGDGCTCSDDGSECDSGGGSDPAPQKPAKPQKPLHVTNVSKSGSNYSKVVSTLQWIAANIDPTCLAFLQSGGGNLATSVNDLTDNSLLAVANFTSTIAAFTGIGGTDLPAGTAAIVVNNAGAFFNSGFTVDGGQYTGGTVQADVFIMLHELGHLLNANGFQSDYGNSKAGQSNDNLISTNCSATLQAAK